MDKHLRGKGGACGDSLQAPRGWRASAGDLPSKGPPVWFGPPRAVIFDFDGVIADTEWLHFECFSRVLAEEGILISTQDHDQRFLGINDRAGFAKAFLEVSRPLPPEACGHLVERKSAYYRRRLGEIRLFPGVADLLRALAARVPLGIGSGGRGEEIEAVLRAHGVRDLFEALLSADHVFRSKPAPDCFVQAMEALRQCAGRLAGRLGAQECLVVEDSVPGVEAAKAAGMRCLAVAHTFPKELLSQADRVVERIGALAVEEMLG